MNIEDFMENFADQFDDTDPSEISAETNFRDLEEWSSMIGLSLLNMSEKKYGVKLTFDELRAAKTVQELFDVIASKQG
ncbi:MAG: acyl carrier protein [Muribaculaceae bacterium]|nr:acyl carrier protein [Muribaculaceae bacterium]